MELNMDVMNKPLVSICCLAYNHEKFIRQCLDGFLIQKCNFNFEVLIHDDASTDKTASIIKEYEKKYPKIIKPIYQTENQYSKNIGVSKTYQYPRAQGKYIALCEGDDYWIDPLKLQKQVDILENNSEIGFVYSNCYYFIESKQKLGKKYSQPISTEIDMINNNISTLTVCFRKEFLPGYLIEKNKLGDLAFGDYSMWLYFKSITNFYFLKDFTSVYRIREESASHSKDLSKRLFFQESVYLCQKYFFLNIFPKNKHLITVLRLDNIKKKLHICVLHDNKDKFNSIYKENAVFLWRESKVWGCVYGSISKCYLLLALLYSFIYKLYSKY